MYRVGILTFQFAHNYGALLQAYSLKRILTNKGISTEILNYLPNGLWENYSLNPIYSIRKKQFKKLLLTPKRIKQANRFFEFQKKELQLGSPVKHLNSEVVKEFDALIVGSDQVWNDSILPDTGPYFFEGISGVTKLAYAASFGTNELTETIKTKIKTCLPTFSAVTVRETSGINLIKSLGVDYAVEHVCDPVFLLSSDKWRRFYKRNNYSPRNKKYILYVDLRNDARLIDKAKELRSQMQYEVVYIHPTCLQTTEKSFIQLYDVGPLEYLWLIDNAEYIVTNSFHAVAFSMIFQKKVFHIADNNLGNRVMDLLETFSLEEKENLIDCSMLDIEESDFVKKSKEIISVMMRLIWGE